MDTEHTACVVKGGYEQSWDEVRAVGRAKGKSKAKGKGKSKTLTKRYGKVADQQRGKGPLKGAWGHEGLNCFPPERHNCGEEGQQAERWKVPKGKADAKRVFLGVGDEAAADTKPQDLGHLDLAAVEQGARVGDWCSASLCEPLRRPLARLHRPSDVVFLWTGRFASWIWMPWSPAFGFAYGCPQGFFVLAPFSI